MEVVYNFKYLGAWTKCSQTEFLLHDAKKIEIQILNHKQTVNLNTRSRELMEVVYNFKYLGAWTKCSQTEFKLWKGMACHTAIG